MNSRHNKPLFVYSYDPPSPDVISEYDPPYPLEIGSPFVNNDSFDFPSIELDNNVSFYNEYSSLCNLSRGNNDVVLDDNISGDALLGSHDYNSNSEIVIDINDSNMADNSAKLERLDPISDRDKRQEKELNEVIYNNVEVEEINGNSEFVRQDDRPASSIDESLISSELSSSVFLDIANEFEDTALIYAVELSENKVIDVSHDDKEIAFQCSTPTSSTEGLNVPKSNDNHMTESKDETCSLTLTSCDASETIYPSDLTTTEEARYSSPASTSQSLSSLLSDTITINVPCESSSPGNESRIFDFCNNGVSSKEGEVLNETSSTVENDTNIIQHNGLSMSPDFDDDSVLFSSSPMISSPLTDSCTITPFPTDFPTPYSTNPTSSPLPYDLLNQQSESSSSTPSTVTSSTMFCVSRKLENLTTNAFASDLASNKENCCVDANQNNEAESAFTNGMQNLNLSYLQTTSVSDTTVNITDMVLKIGQDHAIETSHVSELKKKFMNRESENALINKPFKNVLKPSNLISTKAFQEENKKDSRSPDKICSKENNKLVYKAPEIKSPTSGLPPPPPPRTDSSQKQIPPPLPPPPCEENEETEEPAPPIPSLPLCFTVRDTSPVPPNPPVRQYLLIPLTPGRTTPVLLTPPPPPAPHRSSSYRKSPPPPPPIPPKPRLSSPESDLKNGQKCSSNCLNRCSEYNSSQSNRYLPLVRELTPVPEEVTSPTRRSPPPFVSPLRIENNNLFPSQTYDINNLCKNNPNEDILYTDVKVHKNTTTSTTSSGVISVVKSNQTSPSPPPPLPPKPSGLKPLLSLKTPPPPPPTRTESLPGTPNSGKTGTTLSPYRLKDRSPPNDRKFTSSDSELESRVSPKPESFPNSPNAPPPAPAIPFSRDKSSCLSVSPYGKLVVNRSDLPLPSPEEEIRKVYANVKNWGWFHDCSDTLAIYTQFRPIIQQGPICGLVALAMASQACPSSVSSADLLIKAKEKGISRHGEMFNAEAMSKLTNETLTGVTAAVRKDVLSSSLSVIRILLAGDYILFPYDAEPNHFPGFKRGHKAHWGLLCGCLIQNKSLTFWPEASPFKPDPNVDQLWHLRPVTQALAERSTSVPPSRAPAGTNLRVSRSVSPCQLSKEDKSTAGVLTANKLGYRNGLFNESDFNVICLYRQGKSRNLIYAPLKDICQSNAQIVEYPTTEDYVIDSVEEGLSNQVVVLHKKIQGLSDLLGTLQEEEKN